MIYHLAEGVQVRKEDWGLLFYSQGDHKIYFAKSGDRLRPLSSDGNHRPDSLYDDEAGNTALTEHSVQKLIKHLVERGIIVNEP
jgi:putative mycofactocin binding protein MftB